MPSSPSTPPPASTPRPPEADAAITKDGPSSVRPVRPPAAAEYHESDMIAGKYRLLRVLGEGGMGSVWLAHNVMLEVEVAIKLIRSSVASLETAVRLLQEARAAARVDHPSIVRVLDFGETELGDPFIVMEVLKGESLASALAQHGRLAPPAAVKTLLPVAGALAAAHTAGIVHRDLKPGNIFLVRAERGVVPKIVDFGIAKLRSDGATSIEESGSILGSPDYMSPEQAWGRDDVDGRADVWAFSVVLYEAITGHRPFTGASYDTLVASILATEPMPITELGEGDAALWKILARGLAKEREKRWPTIWEMGVALARWAADHGVKEDVAGTSLSAHWLSEGARRPPPDPVSRADGVPTPSVLSERDLFEPPPRARRARVVAVVVALGLAAAILVATGLLPIGGGALAPAPDAPEPPAPAAAAAPPQPEAAPQPPATAEAERHEPTAEPEAATAASSAAASSAAASSAAVSSTMAPAPRPPPQRQGRPRATSRSPTTKTTGTAVMPVPKQPNF